MKKLFSESDRNGEGTLNPKEFEVSMQKLAMEIIDAGLKKLGLTEHTLVPIFISGVLYMLILITFILTGFAAFTPGTAFGAGIGSTLPLIAGKTAGIGNFIENVDFKKLVDRVFREEFHK